MGYETAPYRVDKPDFNTTFLLYNDSPDDADNSAWLNSATKEEVWVFGVTLVDLPADSVLTVTLSESANSGGSGSTTVYTRDITADGLYILRLTKSKQYVMVSVGVTGTSWEDNQPAITIFALR